MRAERCTWRSHLDANCTSSDRILLVNPPVIDTRYQWLRWNQPLDLLKLSSLLKSEIGCEVKLYDFMLPTKGRVTRTTNRPDTEVVTNGYTYPLWRYGDTNEEFVKKLDTMVASWRPTQVWVTSLTSYWWKSVRNLIQSLRSRLRDVRVIVCGQYPRLETEHALEHSFAHAVIVDSIDTSKYAADFGLYSVKERPTFCALDVHSENWTSEVLEKSREGVNDFAFFSEGILEPSALLLPRLRHLQEQLSKRSASRRPKFYSIMGLYPASFDEEAARRMKDTGFVEFHFEHQPAGIDLDIDSYKKARHAYHKAGLSASQTSAFLFIGLPNDDLERIIVFCLF